MSALELKDRRRRLIRADGTVQYMDKPVPFPEIGPLIGAHTMDVVHLRHLGLPRMVMWVDDNGYETRTVSRGEQDTPYGKAHVTENVPVRALKPVNALATALYLANCRPGTTHQIVGDVLVTLDGDYA